MDNRPYIQISRDMLFWEWWHDATTLQIFLYLLLQATTTDRSYMGVTIKRGQVAASVSEIAKDVNSTSDKVRTALKHLKDSGEIDIKSSPRFSVISVIRYDMYVSSKKDIIPNSFPNSFPNQIRNANDSNIEICDKSEIDVSQTESQTKSQTLPKPIPNPSQTQEYIPNSFPNQNSDVNGLNISIFEKNENGQSQTKSQTERENSPIYNINNNNNNLDNNNIIYEEEKKKKEKKTKSEQVEERLLREHEFYESLIPYVSQYGKEMVREFYDYWSEPNKGGSKMRWELQQTWSLPRRLAKWARNNYKANNNGQSNQQRLESQFANIATQLGEYIANQGSGALPDDVI